MSSVLSAKHGGVQHVQKALDNSVTVLPVSRRNVLNSRLLVLDEEAQISDSLKRGDAFVKRVSKSTQLIPLLKSSNYDACVLDVRLIPNATPLTIRQLRAASDGLAVVLTGLEREELGRIQLLLGADRSVPIGRLKLAGREVDLAVRLRRAMARPSRRLTERRVLVLDWDPVQGAVVRAALNSDFAVEKVGDGWAALERLHHSDFGVLITPPNIVTDNVNLVDSALAYNARLRVVVTSDQPQLADARDALDAGASGYLLLPAGTEQARFAIGAAWSEYANTLPSGQTADTSIRTLVLAARTPQSRLVEQMLSVDRTIKSFLVATLPQAQESLAARKFDTILVDAGSKPDSQFHVVQALRRAAPHLPIVLICDDDRARLALMAYQLGVDEVLATGSLGRSGLAERVRASVLRQKSRLQGERFVRDVQTREASQLEVVRRSLDGMLVVDSRGFVVFANPAAEAMFVASPGELLGGLLPMNFEGTGPQELSIPQPEREFFAEATRVPIDWNGSNAALITLRDVTERHHAQSLKEQLAHTERLAAIGQLAAGVTHEINNPAAYVMANLEAMQQTVTELVNGNLEQLELRAAALELGEMVSENLDGMKRIGSITRDLRNFARIDSNEVSMVDLNDCVEFASKIAFSEIRLRAHLVREEGTSVAVPGSPGKLTQVVTNLLLNAAQAIPEGNTESNQIIVRTGDSGKDAWVSVEDTGGGIDEDALAKIFDPFFTTKPRSQGTGLGLALCQDIVRQHGGTLDGRNRPAGGARFEVRLPKSGVLTPSVPPPPTQSVDAAELDVSLSVLLIDDEPLVLRSLRRMLCHRHSVATALGGAEALEILRTRRDFDLIVCDLMMPDVDGPTVYAELERSWPEMPERVVFCSGGAFTPRAKQFVEKARRPLVEKPLTLDRFEQAALGLVLRSQCQDFSTDSPKSHEEPSNTRRVSGIIVHQKKCSGD